MTKKKRKAAFELWVNLSIASDRFKKVQTELLLGENLTTTQFEVLKILY